MFSLVGRVCQQASQTCCDKPHPIFLVFFCFAKVFFGGDSDLTPRLSLDAIASFAILAAATPTTAYSTGHTSNADFFNYVLFEPPAILSACYSNCLVFFSHKFDLLY